MDIIINTIICHVHQEDVLNQIIALPESLNSNNNQAAIWIYNEYLDSCLSGESIFDNTITYDVCGNSKINKWYLDENDDNTIIRYAADTDKCISVIDDEIMLGNCDEDTVMYYNEKHKFIKNDDDMCLGAGDNKYDEYIKLNEYNYQWYIINTKEGSYFKSKSNMDLCMRVTDNDHSKLVMGDCDENAILLYSKNYGTIESILEENLCLGNSISSSENSPYDISLYKVRNNVKFYDFKSKWEIPVSGDLFFKSVEYGWCIANTVPSTGGLNMRFCKSEDILMRDSFSSNTIRPPYNGKLCMGILNTGSATETRLNMNTCNSNNNDQYWEIRTSYPGSTTTTKKTTTTVTPTPTVRADGKCGSKKLIK
ncbi:hypothetical protein BCR32DRAFT_247105 [Anaeromyces robustus]|uniref:Uncharacterized protein n=1 Tax=Anaeromyces robustus TaxID=1754192 RepID=A0A1Y1WY48_9FUNG|nr:hypothetical protein BCR32DRAFT_247105 [Anaeromyces robustus]|eukprot:ORX78471.1 hypothetical protein BCR32DRAFT_247105 [Anaeromyces robustus]